MNRRGVLFPTEQFDAAALVEFANALDARGYDSLWLPELFGREPIATAGYLLARTERIAIATGIANVYVRDAHAMAQARHTLAELSGGRFVLGLGVSNAALNAARGHAWQPPLKKMTAFLDALDKVEVAAPAPRQRCPTYLAAHGPQLQALGARRTDGVITYLMTPQHARQSRERIGAAAALNVVALFLAETDLLPLSIGAALLGTGGGGNPYIGMLRTRELFRKGATVRVLPLDALPDDAWVGTVGSIGAPVIGIEKISEGAECYRAMRAVEEAAGAKMAALIAAEIGGANAMAPIITAAQAGLPVIDGDGMGRAFPEVQMSTFAIYADGSREGLTAIADDKGNVVVIRKYIDARWLERFARTIVVDMGAGAGAAGAPMPMQFVRRAAIPGTVTQALEIGHAVLAARAKRQNVVERVVDVTHGKLFFVGKIVDVARQLTGGFVRGQASLLGLDRWAGSEARIAIQNENLVLWIDGVPAIMVPDLIMNLELDTGEPITTEMLRYGQRVAVIGMPVHDLMRTPKALEVVGPQAFGYPELTYVPLPQGA